LVRREIVDFGRLLTDPKTMPENSTWYVMTEMTREHKDVGNLYGCRNWVEYVFKPKQNELDGQIRLTQYQNIEKWWEIVVVPTYC